MTEPTKRVLVVEDDVMLKAYLVLQLEQEGFEVLTAVSGEAMFRILAKDDVDLILLDLNLPDGDRLTLAREIRRHSAVPIIVATARQSRDDRMIALGLGADDYVTKPFDPEELALRIRNVIDRADGANGESGRPSRSPGSRRPNAAGGNPGNGLETLFPETPADDNDGGLGPPKHRRWRIFAAASVLTTVAIFGALWLISSPAAPTRAAQEAETGAARTGTKKQEAGTGVTDRLGADQKALTGTKQEEESGPVFSAATPAAIPHDMPDEVATRPMAEVLGYGWALKSQCDPFPQVEWWKYKTHLTVAAYVNRRYRGNWLPYLGKWVRRLVKLQDIHNRESSVVTGSGLVLRGPDLEDYIKQTKKRLFVTRCLADEAIKAADAKTKSSGQYPS